MVVKMTPPLLLRSLLAFFLFFPVLFAEEEELSEEALTFMANTYLENPSQITAEDQAPNDTGYTVNFEDVPVMQLLRFISQISKTNFIFDSNDLKDVQISIVSEDSTTEEDLMAALLQVLQMNGLSVVEQGNNVLIYKNAALSKLSTIISEDNLHASTDASVVTRVFRLFNLSPDKVSVIVKPLVSKDAIVEISAETNHLIVSDITSNVIKIAELLEVLDSPSVIVDVAEYEVQYAAPSALVAYASEILSSLAQKSPIKLIPQPSTKKIFIVSTPYLLNKAYQVLESLDSPDIMDIISDLPPTAMVNNTFQVYKLRYQDGREVADAIKTIGVNLTAGGSGNMDLVTTISSIEWVEINNSLIITGTQEAVDKVVKLIEELDIAPKQVYIEVLILDTTLSNSLDFGVQWVALGNEQNKLAYASGLLDTPPSSAPTQSLTGTSQAPLYGGARNAIGSTPPDAPNAFRGGSPGTGGDVPLSSAFQLGIIGNIIRHNGESFLSLGALISALETESHTSVVVNPRIMTEDNQLASVFVGQNIPYQTTSTTVRDTGTVTQNIQYEDIGVQLRVTPQVGPNNVVTLQIDQSVADIVSGQVISGDSVLLAPTTNKTLTTTRVHVPDDCFLVMSGHIRDEKTYARSGIPCLGSLPWIGPAFSKTEEKRIKRNLVMFIRPHVITSLKEGVEFTNKQGYEWNWDSNPCSILECDVERAPECETLPSLIPTEK